MQSEMLLLRKDLSRSKEEADRCKLELAALKVSSIICSKYLTTFVIGYTRKVSTS
jgi:hypothetical protein